MRTTLLLTLSLLTGCAALPRSLPPEQFRAEVQRGAYAESRPMTRTWEYSQGVPTGRTYQTR